MICLQKSAQTCKGGKALSAVEWEEDAEGTGALAPGLGVEWAELRDLHPQGLAGPQRPAQAGHPCPGLWVRWQPDPSLLLGAQATRPLEPGGIQASGPRWRTRARGGEVQTLGHEAPAEPPSPPQPCRRLETQQHPRVCKNPRLLCTGVTAGQHSKGRAPRLLLGAAAGPEKPSAWTPGGCGERALAPLSGPGSVGNASAKLETGL